MSLFGLSRYPDSQQALRAGHGHTFEEPVRQPKTIDSMYLNICDVGM